MKISLPAIGAAGAFIFLFGSAMSAGALGSDLSFEQRPAGSTLGPTFTFTTTGVWTIDRGSYQGAQNGITPFLGTNMLRFDETATASTDIYQLVDVSSFSSLIATGGVSFTLSAYFNSPLAHQFGLTMLAYFETSTPVQAVSGGSGGFDAITQPPAVTLDANTATWQQLTLSYTPPAGTHFIAIGLNSRVDGHPSYADGVDFIATVVPEPSITTLLSLGISGLCLRRKTRR